jgi:hypothetical protein
MKELLLIVGIAFIGLAGTAGAQVCTGTVGAPPELRSEGQAELTGAIALNCIQVPAGWSVNFDVALNDAAVPITSRVNEAMVSVNGGAPVYGSVTSVGGPGNNDMHFAGISVPAGNSTITFSGIRANANPAYVPLNSGGFGQVTAVIAVTGNPLAINQANNGFFVGIVLPGLGAVSVTGPSVNACGAGITLGAGVNFTVNIPELFPTVFKIQGPNGDLDSETGIDPGAPQADSGTQLAVSMSSLPSGITFYLPLYIISTASGTAVLVTGPGSTIQLSNGLVTFDDIPYVPVIAGATYYYNVTATNPGVSESFFIPLYNSAATFSSGFTPSITVNLGPTGDVTLTNVPRFLGGGASTGVGFTETATVSPTSIAADSSGGSEQVLTVTPPSTSCTWSAYTDSGWIQLAPSSGTGAGTLTVSMSQNTTGVDRSGSIQINDATVSVNQAFTAQVFADVPPTYYDFDGVNLLSTEGITNGCSSAPLDFCPTEDIIRSQAAIFLVRAVLHTDDFPYSPVPWFSDVPAGSFGFQWIQKMYELGITQGCATGLFCPNDQVTRAQMAAFLIRMRYGASYAFDYPPTPYFTDVTQSTFGWSWIQRMAEDNITDGCGYQLYCPTNPVTRGDMATFVMRAAFNELLPAGEPVLTSISPATIVPGAAPVTFAIFGLNTNFVNGVTTLGEMAGITAGPVTVLSPTVLTVQLSAASNAAQEPLSPVVITGTPPGNQEAVLPNGLVVQ